MFAKRKSKCNSLFDLYKMFLLLQADAPPSSHAGLSVPALAALQKPALLLQPRPGDTEGEEGWIHCDWVSLKRGVLHWPGSLWQPHSPVIQGLHAEGALQWSGQHPPQRDGPQDDVQLLWLAVLQLVFCSQTFLYRCNFSGYRCNGLRFVSSTTPDASHGVNTQSGNTEVCTIVMTTTVVFLI